MTRTRGVAAVLGVMAVALAAEAIEAGPAEHARHGFAPVKRTRLFYEVRGARPAVVLIHGGQLDCRRKMEQRRKWNRAAASFPISAVGLRDEACAPE
jgi:poly(3-hydroxybutyrate) depolymerase